MTREAGTIRRAALASLLLHALLLGGFFTLAGRGPAEPLRIYTVRILELPAAAPGDPAGAATGGEIGSAPATAARDSAVEAQAPAAPAPVPARVAAAAARAAPPTPTPSAPPAPAAQTATRGAAVLTTAAPPAAQPPDAADAAPAPRFGAAALQAPPVQPAAQPATPIAMVSTTRPDAGPAPRLVSARAPSPAASAGASGASSPLRSAAGGAAGAGAATDAAPRLVSALALDPGFRLVAPVRPRYPEAALRVRRPGTVRLELEVAPDGAVTALAAQEEPAGWGFGAAAREAYAAARFSAPTVNGEPVRVRWRRTLHFRP